MRGIGIGAVLALAAAASGQALQVIPDSVSAALKSGTRPFGTVLLANGTQAPLRIDSILIRFLDGGADPKPGDFTACRTCDPENIGAYVYGGWLYGSGSQSLRYLRDSLFLIQDSKGLPVSIDIGAGASAPFGLEFPVNCPVCGRPPAYPGATRYAFTFIASDGARAGLALSVAHPTALPPHANAPIPAAGGKARDAAGRVRLDAVRAILFR